MPTYVFIAIILVVMLLIIKNIRIVPQSYAFIIERLGAYATTWQTGIHVKLPFLDKVANKVSLKEKVLDFPPQPVITKDNVTMKIDTVVYMQITDPKLYTYGVENLITAIETLSSTTLRNIIGELELDVVLLIVCRGQLDGGGPVRQIELEEPAGNKDGGVIRQGRGRQRQQQHGDERGGNKTLDVFHAVTSFLLD